MRGGAGHVWSTPRGSPRGSGRRRSACRRSRAHRSRFASASAPARRATASRYACPSRSAVASQVNAFARSRPAHARSRAQRLIAASTRSIADAQPSTSCRLQQDATRRPRLPVEDPRFEASSGHTGRHRLERRQTEALVERGQDQQRARRRTALRAIVADIADVFDDALRAAAVTGARATRWRRASRLPRSRVVGAVAAASAAWRTHRGSRRRSCALRACPAAARSRPTARAASRRVSSRSVRPVGSSRRDPQTRRVARRSGARVRTERRDDRVGAARMRGRQLGIVASDLAAYAFGMVQEEEVVNGDDLRRVPGRNQQRMRGMHDVDSARQRLDRRPLGRCQR